MVASRGRLNVALAVMLCITVVGCSVEKENSRSERPAKSDTSTSVEGAPLTYAALSGATWRPLPQYLPDTRFESRPSKGSVQFKRDGWWSGSDGCNRVGGTYSLTSAVVEMDYVGVLTQIGCDNVSPQALLDGAELRLDPSGNHLTALDTDGQIVVEYAR